MNSELDKDQQRVLSYLQAGLDAYTDCCERGQYGARLRILASLRRAGLIDHHDHPVTNDFSSQNRAPETAFRQ